MEYKRARFLCLSQFIMNIKFIITVFALLFSSAQSVPAATITSYDKTVNVHKRGNSNSAPETEKEKADRKARYAVNSIQFIKLHLNTQELAHQTQPFS